MENLWFKDVPVFKHIRVHCRYHISLVIRHKIGNIAKLHRTDLVIGSHSRGTKPRLITR